MESGRRLQAIFDEYLRDVERGAGAVAEHGGSGHVHGVRRADGAGHARGLAAVPELRRHTRGPHRPGPGGAADRAWCARASPTCAPTTTRRRWCSSRARSPRRCRRGRGPGGRGGGAHAHAQGPHQAAARAPDTEAQAARYYENSPQICRRIGGQQLRTCRRWRRSAAPCSGAGSPSSATGPPRAPTGSPTPTRS